MYLVGLTGGIASGKSYVTNLLVQHGASAIDADEVARQVVVPGSEGLAKVVQTFGEDVLLPTGELDRIKLGEIVFSQTDKRLELEKILHPLIKAKTTKLLSKHTADVVVYAVPLLVEANVDYPFDVVITVEAGAENQLKRLMNSRSLSEAEARKRIDAQTTPSSRQARANFVIDSSGPKEETQRQVDALWQKLITSARAKAENAAH
jgi:dephospho-CoA kinase